MKRIDDLFPFLLLLTPCVVATLLWGWAGFIPTLIVFLFFVMLYWRTEMRDK